MKNIYFVPTLEALVILSYPDTRIYVKAFLPASQNSGCRKGSLCLSTRETEKAIQKYNSESHVTTTA